MRSYELPDGRILRVYPGGITRGGYYVGWETANGYRKQFKPCGSADTKEEMQQRLDEYLDSLRGVK